MFTYSVEVTYDDVKRFNAELRKVVDAELAKRMLDAGAYLHRSARNMMRSVKREKDAAPGAPPYSHKLDSRGEPQKNIKTEMRFIADPANKSVVVGPLAFGGSTSIPAILEHGGTLTVGNKRRRNRKVGDGGEIEIVGAGEGPKAEFFDSRGRRRRLGRKTTKAVKDDGLGRRVVYAKIRTGAQARRANEINELLYGVWDRREATYSPHPFLQPAFDKVAATGKFDDVLTRVMEAI